MKNIDTGEIIVNFMPELRSRADNSGAITANKTEEVTSFQELLNNGSGTGALRADLLKKSPPEFRRAVEKLLEENEREVDSLLALFDIAPDKLLRRIRNGSLSAEEVGNVRLNLTTVVTGLTNIRKLHHFSGNNFEDIIRNLQQILRNLNEYSRQYNTGDIHHHKYQSAAVGYEYSLLSGQPAKMEEPIRDNLPDHADNTGKIAGETAGIERGKRQESELAGNNSSRVFLLEKLEDIIVLHGDEELADNIEKLLADFASELPTEAGESMKDKLRHLLTLLNRETGGNERPPLPGDRQEQLFNRLFQLSPEILHRLRTMSLDTGGKVEPSDSPGERKISDLLTGIKQYLLRSGEGDLTAGRDNVPADLAEELSQGGGRILQQLNDLLESAAAGDKTAVPEYDGKINGNDIKWLKSIIERILQGSYRQDDGARSKYTPAANYSTDEGPAGMDKIISGEMGEVTTGVKRGNDHPPSATVKEIATTTGTGKPREVNGADAKRGIQYGTQPGIKGKNPYPAAGERKNWTELSRDLLKNLRGPVRGEEIFKLSPGRNITVRNGDFNSYSRRDRLSTLDLFFRGRGWEEIKPDQGRITGNFAEDNTDQNSGKNSGFMNNGFRLQILNQVTGNNNSAEAATRGRPTILDQIIGQINNRTGGNKDSLEIQLKPEHLGKVKVKMTVDTGKVTARFVVENQLVRTKLEANLRSLRNNLVKQGFNVDNISIEAEQESHGESGSHHEQSYRENQQQQQEQYYFDRQEYPEFDNLSSEHTGQAGDMEPELLTNARQWFMPIYYRGLNLLA